MDIGFYHLTHTSFEEALPALLGKTLAVGERAVVRCPDVLSVSMLDDALWEVREPVWLPHGTEKLGYAAFQPIWLTEKAEVPNGAKFLFRINGAGENQLLGFTRVFDLFDGRHPESVQRARERWKMLKSAGHTLVYWQQQEKGWKKAG